MSDVVWLIGNKGMLGSQIERDLNKKNIPFVASDIDVDITKTQALEAFVDLCKQQDKKITWILNCSAYTAVDNAEDNENFAYALNVEGPKNIANSAKSIGAKVIHISTDYVFDGTAASPYTENVQKNPTGVYGKTKSLGEDEIVKIVPNDSYIVRTAWLYGFNGKNFVYTMVNLMNTRDACMVVNDQYGSPTFAGDLSYALLTIIEEEKKGNSVKSGVYHYSNEGTITWYDFAKEIYKQGKEKGLITSECVVNPCDTSQFPTKAKRPAYSVLNKEKIKQELGIVIPDWKKSLHTFMASPLYENK